MPAQDSIPPRPSGHLRVGFAAELGLLRLPKVALAVLALVFVPALYVLIYVSSVWDPYGNLARLPVALVNEDEPTTRAGRTIDVGGELVATLERERPFAFKRYDNPGAARAAVQAGEVFFALLIPPDFSRQAAAAEQPARLGVYISEGGNFTAAILSRRFAAELAHTVNEKLARERWAQLVGDPAHPEIMPLARGLAALQVGGGQAVAGAEHLQDGSWRLQNGLAQSAAGAKTLEAGLTQFSDASAQLTQGMAQVRDAVTLIRAKLPAPAKLDELTHGTAELARGATELNDGLGQLQRGVPRLTAGVDQLNAGAAKVPFFGGKLTDGTMQLRAGVTELGQGIDRAAAAAGRLHEGLNQLNPAVTPLAAGLAELGVGLKTLDEKLPAPEKLGLIDQAMAQLRAGSRTLGTGTAELKTGSDQLAAGAAELARGSRELAAGLNEAADRFASGLGGSRAERLAAPVEAVVEVVAPVSSNGPAFSPYFSALSLWVGAVMMSFVFFFRRLPDSLAAASRPVRWLTKAAPLLAIGMLQATVVVGLLALGLRIPLTHPFQVWLVALLGSVTFVSIVLFLITLLGDAGRLLAVVLLILQLAGAGGIYPVALSHPFYQQVHDWLPFTHMLRALRATMFGAFEGRWESSAGILALFAVGAILLGLLLARWKMVPQENYGPAVEF